jgi:hypothetical protein
VFCRHLTPRAMKTCEKKTTTKTTTGLVVKLCSCTRCVSSFMDFWSKRFIAQTIILRPARSATMAAPGSAVFSEDSDDSGRSACTDVSEATRLSTQQVISSSYLYLSLDRLSTKQVISSSYLYLSLDRLSTQQVIINIAAAIYISILIGSQPNK